MITKVIEIFYQKHQEYQQILKDLINHNSNNAAQLKTLKSLEIYDRLYQEWQEANQYLDLIINDKSYAKDIKGLKNTIKNITISMEKILVSRDHNQQISTIFLEIRSGAGGKESWLFNQDLCVMYGHYCEKNNLTCNIEYNTVNNSHITLKISGLNAKELLKYESGVHRVQRVPLTETQGRIHTSTSIVTIIEERPDLIIDLKPQDLRIDTMRSSGAGGQHVNTTDSAVRIVHLPTGIKAECQNDRSQHKNKEGAITQLKAKLAQYYHDQHSKDMSELRNQFSGLRSEKIRTYNFAQNRITDHRINLSLYNLDSCLKGELTKIIDKLNENQES